MKKFYVIIMVMALGHFAEAQNNARTLYWGMGDQNWPTLNNGRSWTDKRNWVDDQGNNPSTNVTNGDLLIINGNNDDISITSSFTISFNNFLISVQGTAEITIKSGVDLTLSSASAGLALEGSTAGNGLTLERRSSSSNYTTLTINGYIKGWNKSSSSINLYGSYSALGSDGLSETATGFGGFNFGSLPVVFSEFSALARQNAVSLSWTVEQEMNVKDYSIERSGNGSNWTVVGSLPASAFSATAKTYSYTDAAVARGNWSYRIRVTDLDGKRTYSQMQLVRLQSTLPGNMKLYPNPATNYFMVNGAIGNAPAAVKLYNQSGQLQWQQTIPAGSTTTRVSISTLPAGYYVVDLALADGSHQQSKLVIVR